MYPYSPRATVPLLVVTTQGNQVVQDSLFNLFRIADARVSSSSLFFFLFFSRFSDPSSFFSETELKAGRRQHAQPYIDGDDGQTTKRRRPRVYTTYRIKTTTSVCYPVLLFNRDIKSTGIGFSGSRREPPIQIIIRGHQMVEKQASNQSSVYVTVKDQRHSSQDFFFLEKQGSLLAKTKCKNFLSSGKKNPRRAMRRVQSEKREREICQQQEGGKKDGKIEEKEEGNTTQSGNKTPLVGSYCYVGGRIRERWRGVFVLPWR